MSLVFRFKIRYVFVLQNKGYFIIYVGCCSVGGRYGFLLLVVVVFWDVLCVDIIVRWYLFIIYYFGFFVGFDVCGFWILEMELKRYLFLNNRYLLVKYIYQEFVLKIC